MKKWNESGHITVFLSMAFLVFTGLAFCVLEGIHGYMESSLAEEAFEEAGNEILADYDRHLFRKYHVYFLDPREKGYLKGDAVYFLNHYGTSGTYGFHCPDLIVTDEKTAVDEKGLFLRSQISKYMTLQKRVRTGRDIIQLLHSVKDLQRVPGDNFGDFGENIGEELPPEDDNEGADENENSDGENSRETDPEIVKDKKSWTDLRQLLNQVIHSGVLLYASDGTGKISDSFIRKEGLPSADLRGIPSGREKDMAFSWYKLSRCREYLEVLDCNDAGTTDLSENRDLLEYLLQCFSCYGTLNNKESGGLLYELEYLIAGKRSDRDNLRSVADRILLLRFMTNYSFASRDPGIRAEAEALAESLTDLMDFPDGKETVCHLLTAALSYGESLLELHALLAGEKVAVKKDASSWNLNFDNAAAILREKSPIRHVDKGAAYKDYLRLFLLLKCRDEVFLYRMMDIMQVNTALKEPGFRMKNCLFSFRWTGEIQCARWFVNLPGIKKSQDSMFEVKLCRVVSY